MEILENDKITSSCLGCDGQHAPRTHKHCPGTGVHTCSPVLKTQEKRKICIFFVCFLHFYTCNLRTASSIKVQVTTCMYVKSEQQPYMHYRYRYLYNTIDHSSSSNHDRLFLGLCECRNEEYRLELEVPGLLNFINSSWAPSRFLR